MRQRVMIAMALVNEPTLLIADEPTTALDVTTQAQILELMHKLQDDYGTAIIMITHDLGVVAEIADEVVVMYAARVAEKAPVNELFEHPLHPYTWGLLGSLPRLEADIDRLVQIPGTPPSLLSPPRGCRFNPRCPYVFDRCKQELPELVPSPVHPEHLQACFLDDATKAREAERMLAAFATRRRSEMADELLKVEHLTKHFPVTRGIVFQKQVAAVKAVDGRLVHAQPWRDARRRGRVGLRQVDDGALHHAAARPDRPARSPSRAATSRRSRAPTCARSAAR